MDLVSIRKEGRIATVSFDPGRPAVSGCEGVKAFFEKRDPDFTGD